MSHDDNDLIPSDAVWTIHTEAEARPLTADLMLQAKAEIEASGPRLAPAILTPPRLARLKARWRDRKGTEPTDADIIEWIEEHNCDGDLEARCVVAISRFG